MTIMNDMMFIINPADPPCTDPQALSDRVGLSDCLGHLDDRDDCVVKKIFQRDKITRDFIPS